MENKTNKLETMAKIFYSDSSSCKEDRERVIKILMNELLSNPEEYKKYENRYNVREEIKSLPFYTVYDSIEMKIVKTFNTCSNEMCKLVKSNKNYKYLNASLKKHREIYYSMVDSIS